MAVETHKREKFGLTRCGRSWSAHPGRKKVKKASRSWGPVDCGSCVNSLFTQVHP